MLLLDEPLSNLDAKLRLGMRGEIKRICKASGITAVYVTHDQKEALSMADGVAVLKDGQLMQQGPPRELYARPQSRFVADFLGETNFVAAQIVSREGGEVVLECPAGLIRSSVFPDDLPEGGNVVCSIRPEAIHLSLSADPADESAEDDAAAGVAAPPANRFAVTRTDLVYLGETAQHHLAMSDGTPITAFELNPRPLTSGANGELRVSFAAADVVILRD